MQHTSLSIQWHELDYELRTAKISDYISLNIEKYSADGTISEQEAIDDWGNRSDAEQNIEEHFPIYL